LIFAVSAMAQAVPGPFTVTQAAAGEVVYQFD